MPDFVEDGVHEQAGLSSCEQHQQHKGGQDCLVSAVAAEDQGNIRNGYKAGHHINEPRLVPAEVQPGIPEPSPAGLSFITVLRTVSTILNSCVECWQHSHCCSGLLHHKTTQLLLGNVVLSK